VRQPTSSWSVLMGLRGMRLALATCRAALPCKTKSCRARTGTVAAGRKAYSSGNIQRTNRWRTRAVRRVRWPLFCPARRHLLPHLRPRPHLRLTSRPRPRRPLCPPRASITAGPRPPARPRRGGRQPPRGQGRTRGRLHARSSTALTASSWHRRTTIDGYGAGSCLPPSLST